ncbi:hypothetical protein, partial [Phocaeicola vulgatus]|uniref:hypothetical protein n=1 Tax=Phocaeicola vulgatus TaxID=821 RepID=UPI0032C11784
WLGYTLKRKLTNQENPLTPKSLLSVNEGFEGKRSPINLQKTYPRNKYITPLLFPAFTDRPHSKPVQSPLFYVF